MSFGRNPPFPAGPHYLPLPAVLVEQVAHLDLAGRRLMRWAEPGLIKRNRSVQFDLAGFDQLQHRQGRDYPWTFCCLASRRSAPATFLVGQALYRFSELC
jgi:hypothetical protein